MPEYLAPGVYVEEVSYRAKSIEGVSTTVTGFIGPTRYGPVGGEPELLTSFADFERIYGGIDPLVLSGDSGEEQQHNYMAHAVRAFFDNGGTKLYVARVYEYDTDGDPADEPGLGHSVPTGSPAPPIIARFPGTGGDMRITFTVKVGPNVLTADADDNTIVSGLTNHDLVFINQVPTGSPPAGPTTNPVGEGLYDVSKDEGGVVTFDNGDVTSFGVERFVERENYTVHLVTVIVSVRRPGRFSSDELIGEFSFGPESRNSLSNYFQQEPESRNRYLHVPFAIGLDDLGEQTGSALADALLGADMLDVLRRHVASESELANLSPPSRTSPSELTITVTLAEGADGRLPTANSYRGSDTGTTMTGLFAFEGVEEISIVAAPGYSYQSALSENNDTRASQITSHLLTHVEKMRYRVAVLDSPDGFVLSEVRNFRGKFDSKHAALYYPWVTVLDPNDPDGVREIELPPSGFVAGIYARNDVEHGVFKAPANEVVRGAIGFELLLNKAQQDVLNPEGINCFRFFEGRGYRLWGARTISSDPEWKYISVRRYFAYLEHSVDKGTQWAVFENNNEPLWANIRRTVEDFLFNEWRSGALMGSKPEEAYFVRCDRSTMTQNDLDNGRLICLVGVAVVKPAEFVIFRIGQWTADRKV
ncbi:MAG: phage tail sheath subtilisin-like domain-containing protein [Acidobacteria bacterium]|nr:phage tail sheath subtilisin-like domain-containing protein [Acidobacteriota bacterium]MCA1620626.1 phage tail sheath subtilisin-like domain-containing protein [Acidobacteriota bacterium]